MPSDITEPTHMHVAFAFFEGDELLHRGEILVGPERTIGVYGEHLHVPLPDGMPFSHKPEIQLFVGLTIEHSFELPACPVAMRYYIVKEGVAGQLPEQERTLYSELRMGVHTSDDWESVQLQPYTLAFKCTVEP
jgi:hypothetical protein